jgi:chemotaxis protein methyltransferase CheR
MTPDRFTDEDFLFLKEKIFQLAGIHITEKKKELVRSRVQSFIRKSEIESVDELKRELQNSNPTVIQKFVNLMTTNKTDFFRESKHFDYLIYELIPRWKKEKKTEIKIWCSASSTGEEPYTIAMVLQKYLPKNTSFTILATDIDTQVLRKAQNGVYPISKSLEIPEEYQPFISIGKKNAIGWFKIEDEIHSRITFKQHNLIESTYPREEIFDVIFCRNVLIYFERKTITKLMEKFHFSLSPNGYLFIGHSESIPGTQHLFATIQPAVFRKVSL